MTLKRTYSSKSKIKIKATELHIKNSFWQCARSSIKFLIHVVLIVNLKYENALYKLIQAPMITSIFFLNVAVFYYAKKQKYCNKTNQFSLKKKYISTPNQPI